PLGSVPTNLSSGPCSCAAIKRYWRSADPRSTAGAEDEASHERARRRTSSQSSSSPVPPRGRTASATATVASPAISPKIAAERTGRFTCTTLRQSPFGPVVERGGGSSALDPVRIAVRNPGVPAQTGRALPKDGRVEDAGGEVRARAVRMAAVVLPQARARSLCDHHLQPRRSDGRHRDVEL